MRLAGAGADVDASDQIVGLQTVSEAVIYPHVFGRSDREVGGVLVGRMPMGGGLPLVTGAIPALSADERRATLTFTQDAWAHVHRELESEFPTDEQIVGWYHSHPGFGIFLSGHDLFIHENFFRSSSQIALVIDPHARTEGVFAWSGSDLVALFERPTHTRDRIVPASEREPAAAGVARTAVTGGPAREGYPLLALAIAAVVGVLLGFGIWSIAEGSTGVGASSSAKRQPTRTGHTSSTPEPNIEVLSR